MPGPIRTVGFSLAYSLATTLGGFTPAISTWLIDRLDNRAAPGLWMTVSALCGLLGVWIAYTASARAAAAMAAVDDGYGASSRSGMSATT